MVGAPRMTDSPKDGGEAVPAPVHPFDAATWQDGLLQSYRGFQVALQSAFAISGTILTIAVIGLESRAAKGLSAATLLAVGCIALFIMLRLRGAIRARGEDVWYWQREVLRAEEGNSDERRFYRFKADQLTRGQPDQPVLTSDFSNGIAESEIHFLVGSSDSRTRRVMEDTIVGALAVLWLVFFLIAAIALISLV